MSVTCSAGLLQRDLGLLDYSSKEHFPSFPTNVEASELLRPVPGFHMDENRNFFPKLNCGTIAVGTC